MEALDSFLLAEVIEPGKVGNEVYGPIFAAGLSVVLASLGVILIVGIIVDSDPGRFAEEFGSTDLQKLEDEFGKEAVQQAQDKLLGNSNDIFGSDTLRQAQAYLQQIQAVKNRSDDKKKPTGLQEISVEKKKTPVKNEDDLYDD